MSTPEFAKVEIGGTGEFLDGVAVTTPAGDDLFRETQVAADPVDAEALARVRSEEPQENDYGLAVRSVGVNQRLSSIFDEVRRPDYIPVQNKLSFTISADFVDQKYVARQAGELVNAQPVLVLNEAPIPVSTGLRQPTTPQDVQQVEHVGHMVSRDQFYSGEVLPRQTAAGGDQVLTFTFSEPVDLLVVFSADHQNHTSSVDPFGGTPSASAGIPMLPGVPQSFPVRTSQVKVFEKQGGEVTVWGYRYPVE